MQLHKYYNPQEISGLIIVISGLVLIAVVLFVQYASVSSLSAVGGNTTTIILSEGKYKEFKAAALPTLAVISAAVGISLAGVNRVLNSWREICNSKGNGNTINLERASVLQKTKKLIADSITSQKKIFWTSLTAYAIIFMFLSSMAIYSRENISNRYGVPVPSYYLTGCCGTPGSFPVLTIYLSEHLGLLLVPSNLILLSFLPLLVAINLAIFVYITSLARASSKARIGKGVSVCGISTGILAGCPTCAGSMLFSLISSGGFASLGLSSAVLAGYQPVFIIISFGVLIAAPIVSASKNHY